MCCFLIACRKPVNISEVQDQENIWWTLGLPTVTTFTRVKGWKRIFSPCLQLSCSTFWVLTLSGASRVVVVAAGLCRAICWAVGADTVTKEAGWNPCWLPGIISFWLCRSLLKRTAGANDNCGVKRHISFVRRFNTSNENSDACFHCFFLYVSFIDATSCFPLCAWSHIVMFPSQTPRLVSDLWTKLRQR